MLPVLNSMNYIDVIKQNFMRKDNPSSYLKFTLIFESDFRHWIKHYMKSRSQKTVNKSTEAVVKLSAMGYKLYDEYVLDITDNQPDLVDYHQEYFGKLFKGLNKADIEGKMKIIEVISKYDPGCKVIEQDRLVHQNYADFGFEVSTKILNTDAFCRLGRQALVDKYGVQFVQGSVNQITYSDSRVHSVGYIDQSQKQHKLDDFDNIVFCGGIETIKLAKLVGLRVPMYGFKGHSLNVYVDKDKMPDSTYLFGTDSIVACRVGLNTTGMIRFTGFADVVGNNLDTLQFRKDQIVSFAKKIVGENNYDDSKAHHWVGLRPVTADDCPIIGKSSKFENLYWNTGHGGRGVSQATSSAQLLQSLMRKEEISIGVTASDYAPDRFYI